VSYAARTKYDEPGRAGRYRERNPRRNAEEWALLARAIDALPEPPRLALDVPCGTGRIAEGLIARGIPTACADLSPAMREETRRRLAASPGLVGVFDVDLEDAGSSGAREAARLGADLVICFRFLHHLPDAATRGRVLATLGTLGRRDLLLSFHHPASLHATTRLVRAWLRGRPTDRHTVLPRRLAAEAAEAGWGLRRLFPLARLRRELWLAWLRRA
jgi:SAM-dependent methyltransferase